MIRVKGLTKIFEGGNKAINNLSLEVEEGEILALLGPNGAGKTTTIRVLSTLSGFDEGEVEVAGFNVDSDPQSVRRSIGVVAQNTGVDYFLTGRENLLLQGQLYRMDKHDIEHRIKELSEYFEIDSAIDRQVMTYSGGMRRKLDIATALIHNPRMLFLDEPTLGLDIKSRQSLWKYIKKLNHEQGLTILLTTHYLEEADKLSHRVAIINQGSIQTVDTPEALKNAIHGDSVIINFEGKDPNIADFTYAMHEDEQVKDVVWQNDRLHIYVDDGGAAIPRLVELAKEQNLTISSLSLAQPTLDDVFLKYTGTTLEDAGEDEGGEEWWHQWAGKGGGGGKWQKNWEKWQTELDESGSEDEKHAWADKMESWQQQESSDGATEENRKAWSQGQGDNDQQGDWQQWQQNAPTEENTEAATDTKQEWPQDGDSEAQGDWQKWQSSAQQNNKD